MHLPDPIFPPLLTGHPVRSPVEPFAEACAEVRAGRLGAGDVVWGRRTDRVELAVVLEPEVPLKTALQMVPVAMVATADCLGALTPPQVAVTHLWPTTICVNRGRVGGLRFRASSRDLASVPDWLVLALDIRLEHDEREREPGFRPDMTAMSEEGCGELTRTELIESWTRHFMTWLHNWQTEGFKGAHEAWLFRAEGREQTATLRLSPIAATGESTTEPLELECHLVGLDEDGNALVKETEAAPVRLLSLIEEMS